MSSNESSSGTANRSTPRTIVLSSIPVTDSIVNSTSPSGGVSRPSMRLTTTTTPRWNWVPVVDREVRRQRAEVLDPGRVTVGRLDRVDHALVMELSHFARRELIAGEVRAVVEADGQSDLAVNRADVVDGLSSSAPDSLAACASVRVCAVPYLPTLASTGTCPATKRVTWSMIAICSSVSMASISPVLPATEMASAPLSRSQVM